MKKGLFLLAALLFFCLPAKAEENDGDRVVKIYDGSGAYISARAARVWPGDEIITADNTLYRVESVDEKSGTAAAEKIGPEAEPARAAFRAASAETASGAKLLVAMYSTHSDESYVPTDGSSSKEEDAGIYDVGEALKKNLEAAGFAVEYSEETFLPHDAAAYRRSRAVAEELLKMGPVAIFDLHRDGIPDPDEYEKTIGGEDASKVRLLVGRSNPNADANRAFAKEIKAAADEAYPGLIKDIYIGKGNYNQEIYPRSVLLEFGTHTIDKERAVKATAFMAEVIGDVLTGEDAKAAGKKESAGAGRGVAWLVGVAVAAAAIYALVASGTIKGMTSKLSRGASEISGGLFGKKKDDSEA